LLLAVVAPLPAQTTAPAAPPATTVQTTATAPALARKIAVGDVDRMVSIRDVQRSPDGVWVAYSSGTVDVARDKTAADIWMVEWDRSERVRLTSSDEAESAPRWSPDGKWLSFVRPSSSVSTAVH
jgi:dipeptidyl aminopeptidase/acylaminoacyl peptidase